MRFLGYPRWYKHHANAPQCNVRYTYIAYFVKSSLKNP